MNACRIACVRYLNTVPLIQGLEKLSGVKLIPTVPSRIAGMVLAGEADVGLVSLIDAAKSRGELTLLPVGMIGCDGPTLTVRLFSSVPLEQVKKVHCDTDSHTSVVLCRVLLKKLYGLDVEVADFDARERVAPGEEPAAGSLEDAWPETVLLIGDKVVVDAPPAERYPYQLDLGQSWKQVTGLPFVYAVWACRSELVESAEVRAACAVLDRQRRHNRMRLDWIVREQAAEHRWPEELAGTYLGSHLRFEVGEREREAAARFVHAAGEWIGDGGDGELVWSDAAAAL